MIRARFAYAVARQLNHALGQIKDLDGLAHIQHEDLSARPHGTRLHDQLCGFGDCHEVANDIRVSNGDGPAAANLFAE